MSAAIKRAAIKRATIKRTDRGAGTVLVAIVLVVIMLATALAVVLVGWLNCQRRARDVADLAALAGARAVLQGRDGCVEAAEVAQRNDATLASCELVGDPTRFVLKVHVSVPLTPQVAIPDLPTEVTAEAVAGPAGS